MARLYTAAERERDATRRRKDWSEAIQAAAGKPPERKAKDWRLRHTFGCIGIVGLLSIAVFAPLILVVWMVLAL